MKNNNPQFKVGDKVVVNIPPHHGIAKYIEFTKLNNTMITISKIKFNKRPEYEHDDGCDYYWSTSESVGQYFYNSQLRYPMQIPNYLKQ